MPWLNRFRRQTDEAIVHEFSCTCPPSSRAHERMVDGATINMRDDCYLEDGVPITEES
jgi:hypothetical protein